jgi:hypothetical protein
MCNSKAQWRHMGIFPNVSPLMPLAIIFDKALLSSPINFLKLSKLHKVSRQKQPCSVEKTSGAEMGESCIK